MDFKRRDFVKGCAMASVLLLPGISSATKGKTANNAPVSVVAAQIERSIKASFGGGFSVQTHTEAAGLTYAKIEHHGNWYAVASADLLDWRIVRSSLSNAGLASTSFGAAMISMV